MLCLYVYLLNLMVENIISYVQFNQLFHIFTICLHMMYTLAIIDLNKVESNYSYNIYSLWTLPLSYAYLPTCIDFCQLFVQ